MYKMNEEYSIGIPEIDEQHEKLFGLINDAQTLLKDENILYKYDRLAAILKGMKNYADRHFRTEVSLMEALAYPELESHIEAHDGFYEKVNSFHLDMETISLGTQDKIISDLLAYLESWLQVHIKDCDRRIALHSNELASRY